MHKENNKIKILHSLLAFIMLINIIVPGIMGPKSLAEEGTPQKEFVTEESSVKLETQKEIVKTYQTEEKDFEFDEEKQMILGLREDFTAEDPVHLIIPDKINGVEVKVIDSLAFYNDENIQIIDLRDHKYLEEIGAYAFAFVYPEQILLENMPALEKIEDYAFYDNQSKLIVMEKLNQLEKIGDYAFSNYDDENFEKVYRDFVNEKKEDLSKEKENPLDFSKNAIKERPYEEGKAKDAFDEVFHAFVKEKEGLQKEEALNKKETLENAEERDQEINLEEELTELDPPAVVDTPPVHKKSRSNLPTMLPTAPMAMPRSLRMTRAAGDKWTVTPAVPIKGTNMEIASVSVEETANSLVWTVKVKQSATYSNGKTNHRILRENDITSNENIVLDKIEYFIKDNEAQTKTIVKNRYGYYVTDESIGGNTYNPVTYIFTTSKPQGDQGKLTVALQTSNTNGVTNNNAKIKVDLTATKQITNKNFNFIVKDNSSPASIVNGAVIKLTDDSGKEVQGTTGANGKVALQGEFTADTEYTLTVVSVPDGYKIPSPNTVRVKYSPTTVNPNESTDVTVTLEKIETPTIEAKFENATITDAEIELEIYNGSEATGTPIKTITIPKGNKAPIEGLVNGQQYTIKVVSSTPNLYETGATTNFTFSDQEPHIVVNLTKKTTENKLVVNFHEDKVDGPLTNKLDGQALKLSVNGEEVIATITNGVATFTNPAQGTYTLVDPAPSVEGYKLVSNASFNLNNTNGYQDWYIVKKGTKVSLEVKPPVGKTFLADMTVKLVDASNNVVQGPVSIGNGNLIFEDVAPGQNYQFVYENVPEYWTHENAMAMPFTIPEDAKETKVTDQFGYHNPASDKSQISIKVVDNDNQPVQGFEFQIKDSSNKVVATVTSGTDGIAKTEVAKLAPGTYTVENTKRPAGYLKVDLPSVKLTDKKYNIAADVIAGKDGTQNQSNVYINVKDINGKAVPSEWLEFYKVNNTTGKETKVTDELQTDEFGDTYIAPLNVEDGYKYKIKLKANSNYKLVPQDGMTENITIEKGTSKQLNLLVELKDGIGRITAYAHTKEGDPAPNLKITIKKDGETVSADTFRTYMNGKNTSKFLKSGTYKVTIEDSEVYQLAPGESATKEVTITNTNKNPEVEFIVEKKLIEVGNAGSILVSGEINGVGVQDKKAVWTAEITKFQSTDKRYAINTLSFPAHQMNQPSVPRVEVNDGTGWKAIPTDGSWRLDGGDYVFVDNQIARNSGKEETYRYTFTTKPIDGAMTPDPNDPTKKVNIYQMKATTDIKSSKPNIHIPKASGQANLYGKDAITGNVALLPNGHGTAELKKEATGYKGIIDWFYRGEVETTIPGKTSVHLKLPADSGQKNFTEAKKPVIKSITTPEGLDITDQIPYEVKFISAEEWIIEFDNTKYGKDFTFELSLENEVDMDNPVNHEYPLDTKMTYEVEGYTEPILSTENQIFANSITVPEEKEVTVSKSAPCSNDGSHNVHVKGVITADRSEIKWTVKMDGSKIDYLYGKLGIQVGEGLGDAIITNVNAGGDVFPYVMTGAYPTPASSRDYVSDMPGELNNAGKTFEVRMDARENPFAEGRFRNDGNAGPLRKDKYYKYQDSKKWKDKGVGQGSAGNQGIGKGQELIVEFTTKVTDTSRFLTEGYELTINSVGQQPKKADRAEGDVDVSGNNTGVYKARCEIKNMKINLNDRIPSKDLEFTVKKQWNNVYTDQEKPVVEFKILQTNHVGVQKEIATGTIITPKANTEATVTITQDQMGQPIPNIDENGYAYSYNVIETTIPGYSGVTEKLNNEGSSWLLTNTKLDNPTTVTDPTDYTNEELGQYPTDYRQDGPDIRNGYTHLDKTQRDGDKKPIGPNIGDPYKIEYEDSIIGKSGQQTDIPGEFDMTLTIEGKGRTKVTNTDIVLVLDNSNSMAYKWNKANGEREMRIETLSEITNTILTDVLGDGGGSGNRIAITNYATLTDSMGDERAMPKNPNTSGERGAIIGPDGKARYSEKDYVALTNNIEELKKAVPINARRNKVNLDSASDVDGTKNIGLKFSGNTNTMAGIYNGGKLLYPNGYNDGRKKIMIVLTDGAPTASMKLKRYNLDPNLPVEQQLEKTGKNNMLIPSWEADSIYSTSKVSFKANSLKYTTEDGHTIVDHIEPTVQMSKYYQANDPNLDIYTVGIAPHKEAAQAEGTAEEFDRANRNITTDPVNNYILAQDDKTILDFIRSKLQMSVQPSIVDGTVHDPMGEQVNLKRQNSTSFKIASSKALTDGDYFLEDNNGNYLKPDGTVQRVPGTKNLLEGVTVSLDDTGEGFKINGLNLESKEEVKLQYKINLDTENPSYVSGKYYPANKTTTLNPRPAEGDFYRYFPIPSVKGPSIPLDLTKYWFIKMDEYGEIPVDLNHWIKYGGHPIQPQPEEHQNQYRDKLKALGAKPIIATIYQYEAKTNEDGTPYIVDGKLEKANPEGTGVLVREVELSDLNNWKETVESLPAYSSKGILYIYEVKEKTKLDNFKPEIDSKSPTVGYSREEGFQLNPNSTCDGNFTYNIGNIETEVPQGSFEITKVDKDSPSTVLKNAVFTLTKKNPPPASGENPIEATTGEDGKVSFGNLRTGTYILKEIKAPPGYVLPGVEYTVTVGTKIEGTKKLSVKITYVENGTTHPLNSQSVDPNIFVYQIENEKINLPKTGYDFRISAMSLIFSAAVMAFALYINKKNALGGETQ